jgi:acetyl esterase/lipase
MSNKTTHILLVAAYLLASSAIGDDLPSGQSKSNVAFAAVVDASAQVTTSSIHYGTEPDQYIKYLLSKSPPQGNIIFIHGGCWLDEYGVDHSNALLSQLAAAGFNAFAPEYRRLTEHPSAWPDPLNDVQSAITFLLERYPNQPTWLVGHSAGGHLAMLASTSYSAEITGVVGLAPIVDLERYATVENTCAKVTPRLVPQGVDPEVFYQEWSPVNRDRHAVTKVFRGSADVIVEKSQDTAIFDTTHIEGAGHFDFIMPSTDASDAWINWLVRNNQ